MDWFLYDFREFGTHEIHLDWYSLNTVGHIFPDDILI